MVNLQKSGDSAVKFVFTDSDHYLYGDGVVEVPVNALILTIDESEMVTFKKLSGDPFISFRADNSNLGTKAAIEQFYKDNMVGSAGGGGSESGITSGDVQTMIDESLDDYYDKDEVDSGFSTVNTAIAGKADTSAVTAVASDVSTLSGQVATKVATSDFNAYSAATDARIAEDEEVTAAALNDLQENKADTSAVTQEISAAISVKADTSAVTAVQQSLSGKQDTLVSGTNIKTINNESILGSGNITISGGGGQSLVYYTEDTSNESATIMVQNDDGLGNRSEKRVFVDGGDIIIESYNETDDGKGNTGTTDTQVDINSLGLSIITSSDDGINTNQTELEVQPMGAYINSEPIATEPYVDAALSGKADTSAVTAAIDDAKAYYIDFTTLATVGIHDDDWDGIVAAIDDHRPIYAGYPRTDGGIIYYGVECMNKNVSNTQIVLTSSDDNSHYFYTFTKNGSNDYSYTVSTKPYVPDITTSITSGSTDSEIPTAKAVYDAIPTGGGATYSAGTNISIANDTINCTLPISAGSGSHSVVFNDSSNIGGTYEKNGQSSLSYGSYSKAHGIFAFAGGRYVNANNYAEMSVGFFNQSNGSSSAQGNNSGNTLFSVGNGTSSARHNAFEIRQNGDIYVNDGTNDVRLQDTILALGGLKLVKLTQAEYDALATKDANTLYIISNVVS